MCLFVLYCEKSMKNRLATKRFVFDRCTYNICMIDVVGKGCPVYVFVFYYWWLNKIVVVSGMVHLIKQW